MGSPIVAASSVGMQILIYLLIILMLLISLTIHELGHFAFAKIFKVNVKEFSIGVGPCLARHTTKRGMRVSLRLIPLVAYVMLDSSHIKKLYADEKENKDYK
jgi:membrane-associated protease RseP (regulator of RpoE activity)